MVLRYILPATRGIAPHTSSPVALAAMRPRRNSTGATPRHASPRQAAGSASGKLPLSLVTTQQVFRASTNMTVETESPISETPSLDLPPMPVSFPQLSLGIGGIGGQSTWHNTREALHSAVEERTPSRPPSAPMSTIPQISEPLLTPTRPRKLTGDGDVDEFTPIPPPHRGPSRAHSRHSTGDYTYRFDKMPSPCSDSGPPHYRSADISGGFHAKVWSTYNKISQ